jgi:TetR/AcrR family transcriptional repressor of nem operon
MSGRPKNFDETEALERAMDLFWRRGYKGTGISDLLGHIGISRQSLYDTFGSKRELFLRVLAHYRATQLSRALEILEGGSGTDIENVKEVVHFFRSLGEDAECRGCLVANSLIEFGPAEDAEVTDLLRDSLTRLELGFQSALESAQKSGELAPTKSPRQIARALTNAVVGMAVCGRLELGEGGLGDAYAGTLSMLD